MRECMHSSTLHTHAVTCMRVHLTSTCTYAHTGRTTPAHAYDPHVRHGTRSNRSLGAAHAVYNHIIHRSGTVHEAYHPLTRAEAPAVLGTITRSPYIHIDISIVSDTVHGAYRGLIRAEDGLPPPPPPPARGAWPDAVPGEGPPATPRATRGDVLLPVPAP